MANGAARGSEDGFTLVEILVAMFVLLIGMLGVLSLVTGALKTTATNNERVGATNLARELIERARSLDYDDMTGTLVQTRLQAAGVGSGSPWTIVRRNTTYTVTTSSCTYDDPADKLAATPPDNVCTPRPSGVTGDSNGEDFRRTTFRIAWTEAGSAQPHSVTQTTLVVNPSGGLGPRITGLDKVTQPIYAGTNTASVTWTTTPATTLRWVVDDGASSGSSTGSTSFTTNWSLGTSGSGSEVLDGTYEITATPFDDRDVAGESKRANVDINRRKAYAPPSLAGGHDTRAGDWVDLQWAQNAERDIQGYRVFWAGPDGTVGNADDVAACTGPAGDSLLGKATTSCTHASPPGGATTYYVVAVDRAPPPAPADQLRDGDRRTLTVGAPGARPNAPTGPLAVATVAGLPTLTWNPPASGGASFYRIYRDGTVVGLADRFGRTSGAATTFTDDSPGDTAHRYWVTTVDSAFNESDPLGPVTWSP
jgi:type IV pilus assembly protein PilV